MNERKLIEQMDAYLRGELPSDEIGELESQVVDNPTLAKQLIEQAREHAILRMWASTYSESIRIEEEAALGEEIRPSAPCAGNTPPLWKPAARMLAIAATVAAVLLAIAAVLFRDTRQHDDPIATLEEIRGIVLVAGRDGEVHTRSESVAIASGDSIRTEDGQSSAVVVFPDATRVLLKRNTSVVCTDDRSKRIMVLSGTLSAAVTRQPAGPMVVTTPRARVEVLGTEFSLAATTGRTDVAVTKGLVRLTQTGSGQSVEVPKGKFVVAKQKASLELRHIPTPREDWSEDFDSLPEDWKKGEWIATSMAAETKVGAVRSVRYVADDNEYYQIESGKAWADGLFSIHEQTHLHFTYQLQRPEWFQIFIHTRPFDPNEPPTATYRFKDARLWWPMHPDQWRTASIPLSRFQRVSDFSGVPPLGEVPFQILFSTQDTNPGLVIDRIWVTRSGNGRIEIEVVK